MNIATLKSAVVRSLIFAFGIGFLALNAVAWMQAKSMTQFVPAGQSTPAPENLTPFQKAAAILSGVTVVRPENKKVPSDLGLKYTTIKIPVNSAEYLEGWFLPAKGRKVVLIFHGYTGSKGSLLLEAALIHSMGMNVMMVDFRGYGGSTGSRTQVGVGEAKDVARAVEFVRASLPGKPIVLYGVSMGAVAVLRSLAHEEVKPAGVILESPFDTLLNTVRNRFKAMGIPSFPSAELLVFWGGVQNGFNGFKHDARVYAKSVNCPVLLMHGSEDPRAVRSQVQAVFGALASSDKKIVEFKGARHELLSEFDPGLWKPSVFDFLTTVR